MWRTTVGWTSQPMRNYISQLYRKASSIAGSSLLPKKGRDFSSLTPLSRPPWPLLPPAQPQLTLSHTIKVGREVLEARISLLQSCLCGPGCSGGLYCYAPLGSRPVAAGQLCVLALFPSNSETGLSRSLNSLLWRISDLQFGQSQEGCPFPARWLKTGS